MKTDGYRLLVIDPGVIGKPKRKFWKAVRRLQVPFIVVTHKSKDANGHETS